MTGQVSEFCGELIDSGHTTILGLAARFGLAVDDLLAAQPDGSTDTYWFLNHRYTAAQADHDFAPVRRAAEKDADAAGYPTTWNSYKPAGRALDHMSVYDWIKTRVPGGHSSRFGRLLDVAYNIEYGAETKRAVVAKSSLPARLSAVAEGLCDLRRCPMSSITSGAATSACRMRSLPRFPTSASGWRMTAIEAQSDGSVALLSTLRQEREQVVADQVILTLPFAVLRTLDYLEGRIRRLKAKGRSTRWALGGTPSCSCSSAAATGIQAVRGEFRTAAPSPISAIRTRWDVTRAQRGSDGHHRQLYRRRARPAAFQPSSPYSRADANPKVAAYARAFLRQFEIVFPGITGRWNGRATPLRAYPRSEPPLLYSFWKVGQYTAFGGYEGVPQGSIHFAGEHTSQDFQGFMEGGAAEGVRAAKEIIRAHAHA